MIEEKMQGMVVKRNTQMGARESNNTTRALIRVY